MEEADLRRKFDSYDEYSRRGLYLNDEVIGGYNIAFGEAIGWPKKLKSQPDFINDASLRVFRKSIGHGSLPSMPQKSA